MVLRIPYFTQVLNSMNPLIHINKILKNCKLQTFDKIYHIVHDSQKNKVEIKICDGSSQWNDFTHMLR